MPRGLGVTAKKSKQRWIKVGKVKTVYLVRGLGLIEEKIIRRVLSWMGQKFLPTDFFKNKTSKYEKKLILLILSPISNVVFLILYKILFYSRVNTVSI